MLNVLCPHSLLLHQHSKCRVKTGLDLLAHVTEIRHKTLQFVSSSSRPQLPHGLMSGSGVASPPPNWIAALNPAPREDIFLLGVLCIVGKRSLQEFVTRPEEFYRLWHVFEYDTIYLLNVIGLSIGDSTRSRLVAVHMYV
jgi:hypothetical protein